MEKVLYKKQEHPVYTQAEADAEGIEYVPWREVTEDTEWILSDDGHVLPIVYRSYVNCSDKDTPIWECPFGKFSKYKKLLRRPQSGEERNNIFWTGKERVGKLNAAKKLFVYWYLRTGDIEESFRRAYPNANTKSKRLKYLAASMLQKKEVQQYMESKFKDILAELGIDEKFILQNYKDIVTGEEPGHTKVTVLKELSELLGMKKKITKETVKAISLGSDTLKALQAEKQQSLQIAGGEEDETETDYEIQTETVE